MRAFELNRKQILGDEDWPLSGFHARLQIDMDFGDRNVPTKAQRRIALRIMQELLAEAHDEDLSPLSLEHHRPSPLAPRRPEPVYDDEEEPEDPWEKPDELDLRIIKSAHRVIQEVHKRGQSGRAVMASELVGSIGLSAPTLGRLLREGEPAYNYLSQFVLITPQGRTKALDLKPEGRVMASKIRAGVVPS